MNLGELRAELEKLKGLPDTTRVVLATNPEGLNYSPAGSLHEGWYVGDESSGDMYLTADLREFMDDGDKETFPPVPAESGAVEAVFLYPQG